MSRDRTYLLRDRGSDRVPVRAVHDLPHLVVESLFGLGDGLWGELAQGSRLREGIAAASRLPVIAV